MGTCRYSVCLCRQWPTATGLRLRPNTKDGERFATGDDIALFEYVKRNNRETGAALVGIELGSADGLAALLERMERAPMQSERLEPGSPAYHYLT